MRGSPTRVALRSAPPRPHTLRATPPLSARARPSFRVPPRVRACVGPSPLQAPLLWARRETREGWGTARRGLGWAHRPSYPRGYAGVAGCVKAGGGGGRADPPPCVRGRLAGVARAEEDWAVRAVPPLARVGGAGRAVRPLAYAGRAGRGLGWRGPRGGGGAPSLLSLCGRGGAGRVGLGRRRLRRRGLGWNWVCERRTPTPPPTPPSSPLLSSPLLSSRSPPLAYPTRVEKWTQRAGPFARREGAHGSRPLSAPPYSRETGAHEDEGRAGPSPVSDRPTTFARARRPPAPPFPPTALSARKEDTSPLPCPRRPVRAERSPSAQATPAQPHAPRPPRPHSERRDGAPPPPRGPRQPNPPPRPASVRKRTDGASSPAHARKGRDGAHSPVLLGAGHASQPPAHARGRVGASTPSSGFYAPRHARVPPGIRGSVRPAQPPPRGTPALPGFTPRPEKMVPARGRAPRTHAREGGTRNEGRARAESGGVARRVFGRGGCGAERNPGGGAAHERKGGTSERGCESERVMARGVVNEGEAKPVARLLPRERRAPPRE
ncbi:hypothetical protein EDB84DRAFT_1584683 [Lactarius hengduanensis]|nr:hypothetical protein EDB84DRAFT_1584683 [Lactarius hengduanensis]